MPCLIKVQKSNWNKCSYFPLAESSISQMWHYYRNTMNYEIVHFLGAKVGLIREKIQHAGPNMTICSWYFMGFRVLGESMHLSRVILQQIGWWYLSYHWGIHCYQSWLPSISISDSLWIYLWTVRNVLLQSRLQFLESEKKKRAASSALHVRPVISLSVIVVHTWSSKAYRCSEKYLRDCAIYYESTIRKNIYQTELIIISLDLSAYLSVYVILTPYPDIHTYIHTTTFI